MIPTVANAGDDHGLGTKRDASPYNLSAERVAFESRELFK